MSKNNVMVRMADGENKWISLGNPVWEGRVETDTGLTLIGIYVGIRSKRVVVETYSIFTDRNGACVGTRYHEADSAERIRLADSYGVVASTLEENGIIEAEQL